ncbi:MAG: putative integral rane protein [Acidimicrobiaceae bacterium]|jgi:uncharacterized membrane protein|nr:putative integral rane protein [Acidimicrobiaceae bacterium]MDQ1446087.1 putative integral rane protein [Acidimicrobiaceae bacterium]
MGPDSGLYKAILVLHILTILFGLGPLVLSFLYNVRAEKIDRRAEALVGEVNAQVAKVPTTIVYFIFVTGALLVMVSDGVWKFGRFWISVAMVSFVVALGISHGILVPNERRMNALRRELADMDGAQLTSPPEQAVELADRAKRAAAMGGALNVIVVFIIYLMVFKPAL